MKRRLISLSLSLVLLGISTTGSFAYRLAVDIWNPDGTLLWTTCFLSGGTCLPTVIVRPEQ
jgi:hypothetical protein